MMMMTTTTITTIYSLYCRDCFQPLHFQHTHADPDPSMTFEAHHFAWQGVGGGASGWSAEKLLGCMSQ